MNIIYRVGEEEKGSTFATTFAKAPVVKEGYGG